MKHAFTVLVPRECSARAKKTFIPIEVTRAVLDEILAQLLVTVAFRRTTIGIKVILAIPYWNLLLIIKLGRSSHCIYQMKPSDAQSFTLCTQALRDGNPL